MASLGHQKAISFLLKTSMIITASISYPHATIAKWMRETCPKMCKELDKPVIKHFYDLWHIRKSKYYIRLDPTFIHYQDFESYFNAV